MTATVRARAASPYTGCASPAPGSDVSPLLLGSLPHGVRALPERIGDYAVEHELAAGGGAGYVISAYGGSGRGAGSDVSFPRATHELVLPESMVDDAYGRDIEHRLPPDPQPDGGSRKGSVHYSADRSRHSPD
ncbi:hypothetical protein [Streptomyces tanashiensis]|uniref:hypothetical protein n=1 Tax=Streptomyces tanashiensis TaxID=67367 RepID=UPI0034407FB7